MKGIELSRLFYEEVGKKMLEEQFSDLLPYIAVGFVGSGSERFGFDDDISRDHDFEAGFSIFLPEEEIVDRRQAFLLERAYNKLPKEFMGVKREMLSPVGGSRNGPVRTSEFYQLKTGINNGELTLEQWLNIPDYALAEATNGEVFYDGFGQFTEIRNKLQNMPEDVRLKKLAGNLLIMAQSGQYNYFRCIKRKETEAAQLAANEFVNSAIKVLFLLNRKYAPYYKWVFHSLRTFEEKSVTDKLSNILLAGNDEDNSARLKYDTIEEVCEIIIRKLQEQGITKAICTDIEKHAYSVNDAIENAQIRNLNILISV